MYTKPVKTIDEIIVILRERGFLIPQDQEARVKHFLETEWYYHSSSYIKSFYAKGKRDRVAKANIPFENVIHLYYCEKNLQHLILRALLKIETFLKAKLVHITCDLYKDPFRYKDSQKIYDWDVQLVEKLVNEIIEENQKSPIISDFRKKHGNADLPFWYLAEVASFGPFIKFFHFAKEDILNEFYILFGVHQHHWKFYKNQFFSRLSALCRIRNRVAHSEILWSIRALPEILLPNYKYTLNTTTSYICLIAWFLSKAEESVAIKMFYDMMTFLDTADAIKGVTFHEKQRMGINGNRIEKMENWAIWAGLTPDKITFQSKDKAN